MVIELNAKLMLELNTEVIVEINTDLITTLSAEHMSDPISELIRAFPMVGLRIILGKIDCELHKWYHNYGECAVCSYGNVSVYRDQNLLRSRP